MVNKKPTDSQGVSTPQKILREGASKALTSASFDAEVTNIHDLLAVARAGQT